LATETGIRPLFVVFLAPFFKEPGSVEHVGEPVGSKALVSKAGMEGLNESILLGLLGPSPPVVLPNTGPGIFIGKC
jgi:hypothetical protein